MFSLAVALTHLSPSSAEPTSAEPANLDAAIASMRNIEIDKLDRGGKSAIYERLDTAWNTLMNAGDRGRERILRELKELDEKRVSDDFFRIDASMLLWFGWKFDAIDTIVAIWESTPNRHHYDQAFSVAYEAAKTRDTRALPLMKSLLRNDTGTACVPLHSMTMRWPLPLEFVWGVYGPGGGPELLKALKATKDPVVQKSCVILLVKMQYLEALPTIREIARKGEGEGRLYAIEWLGVLGHPDDREFLISGLKSTDPKVVVAHLMGLAGFEDMSTATAVAPTLNRDDELTRRQTLMTLSYCLGVDALISIHDRAVTAERDDEREACNSLVNSVLAGVGLDYESLTKLPRHEADEKLLAANPLEAMFRGRPGDRRCTHDELVKALDDWIARNRITGGPYAWLDSRHVLGAATVDDLNKLLEVRASVYRRLSDECLSEVAVLEDLIRRIGRRRFRRVTGLCVRAEAPPPTPARP